MRWNDDRLDDLQILTKSCDSRLDRLEEQVRTNSEQLTQIAKTGDRRSERSWALKLALATVAASSVTSTVLLLLQHR